MSKTHLGYHAVFHKSEVCVHFEYCNVAKISGRDCAKPYDCQSAKYYKKYPMLSPNIKPSQLEEMFIGSKI